MILHGGVRLQPTLDSRGSMSASGDGPPLPRMGDERQSWSGAVSRKNRQADFRWPVTVVRFSAQRGHRLPQVMVRHVTKVRGWGVWGDRVKRFLETLKANGDFMFGTYAGEVGYAAHTLGIGLDVCSRRAPVVWRRCLQPA
jgi:hypothetical protein